MTKYKYYVRKPKGEIVRDMLFWIGGAGVVVAAVVAPKAFPYILRAFAKQFPKSNRKSASTVFHRLLKNGSIEIERRGKQIYISLTDVGRKRAGWFQINSLCIKKPKRWDKKWRVVIFDITNENRLVREALRGLLKRLNFCQLQKSVWACPYDCKDEIALLRDFFGLSFGELQLLVVDEIESDTSLRKYFFNERR